MLEQAPKDALDPLVHRMTETLPMFGMPARPDASAMLPWIKQHLAAAWRAGHHYFKRRETTDTPQLVEWRKLVKDLGDDYGPAVTLARALGAACDRIADVEAENAAFLEGTQELEYDQKERIEALEAEVKRLETQKCTHTPEGNPRHD